MVAEKIIYKTHPHFLSYFFYYLGGFLIIFLGIFSPIFGFLKRFELIFLGLFIIGFIELLRVGETFYLTENGLGREFKLIVTNRIYTHYQQIQDLQVVQGIFDRIVGIGSIFINTAGSPNQEIVFRGLKNPYLIAEKIRQKISSQETFDNSQLVIE